MATIASLSVLIKANANQLLTTMPTIGASIQKAASRVNSLSGTFASFARGTASQLSEVFQSPLQSLERILKSIPYVGEALALIPAAAGSGLGAVISWFEKGSANILDLNAAALRLNTTIEDIQPILVLAGDSAESASKGIFHMQRTIAEATMGSDEAQKKLAHLGLTAADLAGKTTGQQFGIIADRLNATKTAGEKAAFSVEVFSRSASEMGKVIRRGSSGLEAFRQKMEQGGMNFTSSQAAMVKQATLAMKQFDRTLMAVKTNLAIALAPVIEAIVNWFGRMKLTTESLQNSLLGWAKLAAVAGVLLKNVFTPWKIVSDGKTIASFFKEVKSKLEEARQALNEPLGTGSFMQGFVEHADELTKKLRDQTEAYGRNSTAIELNRLARERSAGIASMQAGLESLPEQQRQREEQLRQKIQELEAARDKAVDKYQWPRMRALDAQIERLQAQLSQLNAKSAQETKQRQDDFRAAKEQADAIYRVAEARALELEALDKLTTAVVPAISFYDEYRVRLAALNAAFNAGQISAEGFGGAMRKIGDALEKAEASKASELFRQSRTPLQAAEDKIAELNTMLERGAISWQVYEQAVYGAAKSLMDLHKAETMRMSGSSEFGSQEAYKTINQNILNAGGKQSGLEQLKDAMKQQLQLQQQQKKDLDDIAKAARKGFLALGRI